MYKENNYESLIGLQGFSDQLLQNHFTLYGGYVKNTNILLEELTTLLKEGMAGTPKFAELKRRFGWEFNGMRLHELYFGNMAKNQKQPKGSIMKKLIDHFGSYDAWEKEFKAIGAMRGIGWVVLVYDPTGKQLINVWITEHDIGHLAGTVPLLVMDVFEHAYMLDYGLKKAEYINAFFKAIAWDTVEERGKSERI